MELPHEFGDRFPTVCRFSAGASNGLEAFCWAVVAGYDLKTSEYLIRHHDVAPYRVRYDLVGRTDPVNWLHAEIFAESKAPSRTSCSKAPSVLPTTMWS